MHETGSPGGHREDDSPKAPFLYFHKFSAMSLLLFINSLGLEVLRQHLYNIQNQQAHNSWAQRRMCNTRVLRWPENAILRVFVVNCVQEEYKNVFSQMGKSFPLPPLVEGRGSTAPAVSVLQASLDPDLQLLDECFKREKMPLKALTTYLKAVPSKMTLSITRAFCQPLFIAPTIYCNPPIFGFRPFPTHPTITNPPTILDYRVSHPLSFMSV